MISGKLSTTKALGQKYTGHWYNIEACFCKISSFKVKLGYLILLPVTILCLFLVHEFVRQWIANHAYQQLNCESFIFRKIFSSVSCGSNGANGKFLTTTMTRGIPKPLTKTSPFCKFHMLTEISLSCDGQSAIGDFLVRLKFFLG